MFSNQHSPRTLPAFALTGTDAPYIIISHCARSVPSAASLRSCLRVFGERPVTSAGGARPRPADHPPGQVPPPAALANRARPHFQITLCMSHQPGTASSAQTYGQSPVHLVYSLALAVDILAPYFLLDGEPSQPSTGIRSIPDHFSSIGWPRLVPSLMPGVFKQPGSLLRQLLLA